METKRLSSALTLFYKYVVSLVLLALVAISLAVAVTQQADWYVFLGFAPGTIIFGWVAYRLLGMRRVWLQDGRLLVSAGPFLRRIVVPLSAIAGVEQRKWGASLPMVTVRLKDRTHLGGRFWFVAEPVLLGWKDGFHPTVIRLRELVAEHSAGNGDAK